MAQCVPEKGEMQYFPKEKVVLSLVVSSLILFAFMFLMTTNNITNVSAVEANGVGVYWDSNCIDRVPSIDWGTLAPGSVKSTGVYIRNEVEEPIYLITSTMNWNPSKASDYITLTWDYTGQLMNPNETLQITLTLSISHYIEGISSFSFDVFVIVSQRLPGDVDGDCYTGANDQGLLCAAWGAYAYPGSDYARFDPRCDFDCDGYIGANDEALICAFWGREC